jgi:hypothetical protein
LLSGPGWRASTLRLLLLLLLGRVGTRTTGTEGADTCWCEACVEGVRQVVVCRGHLLPLLLLLLLLLLHSLGPAVQGLILYVAGELCV